MSGIDADFAGNFASSTAVSCATVPPGSAEKSLAAKAVCPAAGEVTNATSCLSSGELKESTGIVAAGRSSVFSAKAVAPLTLVKYFRKLIACARCLEVDETAPEIVGLAGQLIRLLTPPEAAGPGNIVTWSGLSPKVLSDDRVKVPPTTHAALPDAKAWSALSFPRPSTPGPHSGVSWLYNSSVLMLASEAHDGF